MRFKVAILFGFVFFVAGLITLPHYGINWDTINHLPRGQAYLHYFLTGKKDYSDLPAFKSYWQNPDKLLPAEDSGTRSFYQNDATTLDFYLEYDGYGHPPLSDILSSIFNRILFGKMRIINDIDSYRVYGIFLASILVGLIFYWISNLYGRIAGFIASISLATYPLFWSESHFNTEKDVPEAVYFGLLLFSFWQVVKNKSFKWILISGVFFGLALGTKLNILFIIPPVAIWYILYSLKKGRNTKFTLLIATIPLIGILIFVLSWPYLWQDIYEGLKGVLDFYRDIGITQVSGSKYLGLLAINIYPIKWIFYSTPPATLFLSSLGIIISIYLFLKKKDLNVLLFLLWFLVPIARVSLKSTTIYGGVRQIMEYIPAMAILAGLGGNWLVETLSKKISRILAFLIVVLPFAFLILNLVRIHPNENVYFNFLVGGLKGAREKNLHAWGNSFGAAYRQAVSWINKNAEKNARVVLVYELLPNIPTIWFREDITFHNSQRSGYLARGEYALTLTYEGMANRSYYDSYLTNFTKPVYETRIDDVPIIKVWRNDLFHRTEAFKEKEILAVDLKNEGDSLIFDAKKTFSLSRLEFDYDTFNCNDPVNGMVYFSENGKDWNQHYGPLESDWRISFLGKQPRDGKFIEPFLGENIRYLKIITDPKKSCLKKIKNFHLFSFNY